MPRHPLPSIATLAVLLSLTTVSESTVIFRQTALAQTPVPSSPPAAVPAGTTVRISSSNSMTAISQTLKQKFEAQFSGTKVELGQAGADQALQDLRDNKVDLAAIGRPLTPAEQAEGLVQTPVTRHKIAIVVGDKNPFPGDITGEQFAQIFRGEITNWSQVGGSAQPIRVLDRPASDTRQALRSYPVFSSVPFQTGATAVPVAEDSIASVIQQLGDDGISYAIVDQVINQPGVRIVSLYGTLPSDPNYAFSQPLTYVYKGPANPAVQAFLGYAAAPDSQPAIAKTATATAPLDQPEAAGAKNTATPGSNQTTAVPSTVAQAPAADVGNDRTGVPWWLWLLSIPILGALLWAIFRGLDHPTETLAASGSTAEFADDSGGSRIILVPRNSKEAYAYWEVPESFKQRIRDQEGGHQLALRLYDVTGLDFTRHPAHDIQQFECGEFDQDLHIPISQSDRDYLAEIGYTTEQGRWLKLAQSNSVHIPADDRALEQSSDLIPDSPPSAPPSATSPMPILPTFPRFGEGFKSEGMPLVDLTPSELTARDSTVDTGNSSETGNPLETGNSSETQSMSIAPEIDSPLGSELSGATLAGAAAAGVGAGAVMAADPGQRATRVRRSRIVLVPLNSQDAYAYWEVLDHHKEIAKQHDGQTFILRICDVTGINPDQQAPHRIQQFNCEETDRDRHISVPDAGNYVAEIGYLAKNGRWLRIARSIPVSIPAENT